MSGPVVAVVGATGAVGRTMVSILEQRAFPLSSLRLMASARSAGSVVSTAWGELVVEELSGADPGGVDIALFSAGASRSKEHAGRFVDAGSTVIDNSSAFRMDPEVPLVVAQVNDHAAAKSSGIIANPNCTTMTLMMAAGPLHEAAGLRSIVATSYQAVSGSGQQGIDELLSQSDALLHAPELLVTGGWDEPNTSVYPRPIAFNALPFAGNEVDGGYTDEEMKLVNESRKILDVPELNVEPTCVRVPVLVGHGIATTLRFERSLSADEAMAVLSSGGSPRPGLARPPDRDGRRSSARVGGRAAWLRA